MRKNISHRVAVVTSFNNELFDKYAKRTISTYSWPFPLYVYSEDLPPERIKELDNYESKIIKFRQMFDINPECKEFVKRNLHREVNNYLYDAVRFCYHSFTTTHMVLNNSNYDIIIWIDADNIFSNKIMTEEFVYEKLTGENIMLSYYGRDFKYSESGLQVYNLNHPKIYECMEEIRRMYTSDEVYKLGCFTDCHVFDHVREKFEKEYDVINKDLSSEYDMKQLDPIASSFMNVYFDHLKGPNKHRDHHPTWLKEKGLDFLL